MSCVMQTIGSCMVPTPPPTPLYYGKMKSWDTLVYFGMCVCHVVCVLTEMPCFVYNLLCSGKALCQERVN